MEESNPHSTSQSKKSALVLSPVALVAKQGHAAWRACPALTATANMEEGGGGEAAM